MSETKRNKELNFKGIISFIFILGVGIFLLTISFDMLNKYRSAQLYKEYATESEAYMKKNHDGLQQIFADMQSSQCEFTPCGSAPQDEIMHLITHDLKDFSSTAFVAMNKSNMIIIQRLSGEREILYSSDPNVMKLREAIVSPNSPLPWDDYTYLFEGKEVVVQFKNPEGKVMGLLMRAAVAK